MSRHRFEPARLVLGLLLVGAALTHVLEAIGVWRVPVWALLALVPAALAAAACAAAATFAVRRLLRRKGRAAPREPGGMPMDELRLAYGRLRKESGDVGGRPGGSHGGGPEGGEAGGG